MKIKQKKDPAIWPPSPPPLSKRIIFAAATVFLSVLVVAILSELLIRIFAPQDLSGSWTEISDWGYYINKSDAEVRHQFGKRVLRYRFNDLHLRGGEIAAHIPKILVLGDSYTFGFLLPEKDTFVQQLQARADVDFGSGSLQFLNGGIVGGSTATNLAFLEQFGEQIKPQGVLVFLNTDDIGRSIKNQLYVLQKANSLDLHLHKNRLKIGKYKRLVNHLPFYQWLLEHSHLVQFLRVRFLVYFQERHGDARFEEMIIPASNELQIQPDFARAYGHALFRRMQKWCSAHGAKLLVLTTGFHFLQKENPTEPTVAFMSQADEIFRHEAIPFKDISPAVERVVEGNLDSFIIPADGHPNASANRLIAELAWSWLKPQVFRILSF